MPESDATTTNSVESVLRLASDLPVKKWRCTHGHKWESQYAIAGISFPPNTGEGVPGRDYCHKCVIEWMDQHWGQVREDT